MQFLFTKHVKKKFADLAKIGVLFTERDVLKVVKNPDHVDELTDFPNIISSKSFDKKHVLRVVFKSEYGIITIITFYPTRKGRYYEK